MKRLALLFAFAFSVLARVSSTPPTFARDIASLLYQNCASCHHLNAAAPFPLLTYEDAKKHARQIADVTRRRYMPPWLPEHGYGDFPVYGDFKDERRLTDEQIRLIADWVRAGSPEGDPSQAPPAPRFDSAWQLGPPDMVLQASRPLAVPASGPDTFWNFIFAPDLKTTRYVRAIEIRPGASSLVHHANLLIDRAGATRKLERAPGAGFPGMELTLDRNPFDPDSHFLFWKPGSVPYSEPEGFSWRLDPGNLLVLNTHIQSSGKPEQLQPSVGLYFTDQPPTHFPLLIQLEHDGALDIPPGARDFVVSDDFRMPIDADVLAVYPHAHYLGKLLEVYATLPDGARTWLIRIPDWDANWQAVYRYRQPVFLPKGSVISMRFHYDNSSANPRNPHNPPQRVEAGNQAMDEMGHLWLQVLPRGRGDHRRPLQEALTRHRLEKYPNDFSAHLNLGALLLSRLDAQDAESMLEAAVRINPQRPEAHDMLGSAFVALGRSSDALDQFRLALRVSPDYIEARYDLAIALAKSGKLDEAIENFRLVLAAFPDNARLQSQFNDLLARRQAAGR